MSYVKIGECVVRLVKGDITKLKVDAIVNAANSWLRHGGGVAAAIVRAGGRIIQEESSKIVEQRGPVKVGEAVYTTAGSLEAKYVIHTVGPRMGEGDEDEKLRSATLNSLKLAEQLGLGSIAFPAVSTGVFGYPKDRCAQVMLKTIKEYVSSGGKIMEIILCLYDDETYRVFEEALWKTF
ncbi:MAG: macro domain-containing protein [Candidatus Brockarchaeota archaeon]|nr:macro domain-containing protein [Candidatus Brockarchaeota archaeon]MBO3808195.1 macro domain-containing protein [Candidatus Brockarchaeota archaeon]MBO3841422.1 macro domain-containing protein [Candidatus Brockarchaeota archaeon]